MVIRTQFFMLFFLSASFASRTASAAQVAKTSSDGRFVLLSREFEKNVPDAKTKVCLFEGVLKAGCGYVAKLTPTLVAIRLEATEPGFIFEAGQSLEMRTTMRAQISAGVKETRGKVSPARKKASVTQSSETGEYRFDVSGGFHAGFDYLYPVLHFQFALSQSFAVGLQPLYIGVSSATSSVTGFGGFATLSYSLSGKNFNGFSLQAGAGLYQLSLTLGSVSETLSAPAGSLSLQWRGDPFEIGVHFGLGAGAQYIMASPRTVELQFKGFLPAFTGFVAYPF